VYFIIGVALRDPPSLDHLPLKKANDDSYPRGPCSHSEAGSRQILKRKAIEKSAKLASPKKRCTSSLGWALRDPPSLDHLPLKKANDDNRPWSTCSNSEARF